MSWSAKQQLEAIDTLVLGRPSYPRAALVKCTQPAPDPKRLSCYAEDIHANLLKTESRVDPVYLKRQPHITFKSRAILVDWVIAIHYKFKLETETLFLAVNIIDRYLERVSIEKKHLQLLGATSLLIASKYEEQCPPFVRDFWRITEYTYQPRDLLRMERDVLAVLKFEITTPSTVSFLQRYAYLAAAPSQACDLAGFLTELALVESHMLQFKPSVLAEGALCTALDALGFSKPWRDSDQATLTCCMAEFKKLLKQCRYHPLTAVKDKYSHLLLTAGV